MRVLIACEFSGVVRRAFAARGHFAVSVDLIPAEDGPTKWGTTDYSAGWHYQGDVLDFLAQGEEGSVPSNFDLMIAHPPCTFLCNSGVKWLYNGGRKEGGRDQQRWAAMKKGTEFFRALLNYKSIPLRAVENPRMHSYAADLVGREASQYIQPWEFGHGEIKATGLWLCGLPYLQATKIARLRTARVHLASPGPDQWKERSRTLTGIAEAMAEQWGEIL